MTTKKADVATDANVSAWSAPTVADLGKADQQRFIAMMQQIVIAGSSREQAANGLD